MIFAQKKDRHGMQVSWRSFFLQGAGSFQKRDYPSNGSDA